MFRFNFTNYTIEDKERGLLVTQDVGPGHRFYAGLMEPVDGGDWKYRFLVWGEHCEQGGMRQYILYVRSSRVEGDWDRAEPPLQLAQEAAFARTVEFYEIPASQILLG